MLRQLLSAKLIAHDPTDRDRLFVTEDGQQVLRGQAPFMLREDVLSPARNAPRAAWRRRRRRARGAEGVAQRDRGAQRQPAYVIFPDRTLIEMAARRPRNLDELAAIHGVGIAKLQKYGAPCVPRHHPGREADA